MFIPALYILVGLSLSAGVYHFLYAADDAMG